MNVSFLHSDLLNTVIIDSANEQPLYKVDTPSKLFGRTTTIQRIASNSTPSGEEQLIAQIHWGIFSKTTIDFMGTKMDMDDFLRKSLRFMSNSTTLTGNDGREYKWKEKANTFSLVDGETKSVVAESHRKKIGLFSAPRKMNLDILPQVMHSLDIIIVSFIIMEDERSTRPPS